MELWYMPPKVDLPDTLLVRYVDIEGEEYTEAMKVGTSDTYYQGEGTDH